MPWFVEAVYILWIVTEILLARLRRSASTSREGDRHSLTVIWVVIVFSIAAAVALSLRTNTTFYDGQVLQYLGLLLILAGVILRLWVVRSLGRAFTVDVAIVEGHQLHTTGFHRLVRHPSYSFSLLSFLGLGLSLDNVWSLMAAFIPPVLAFRYRIHVEESLLLHHFGDEYRMYMRRTWMLIPYIY